MSRLVGDPDVDHVDVKYAITSDASVTWTAVGSRAAGSVPTGSSPLQIPGSVLV
jgi:hypothetical protein